MHFAAAHYWASELNLLTMYFVLRPQFDRTTSTCSLSDEQLISRFIALVVEECEVLYIFRTNPLSLSSQIACSSSLTTSYSAASCSFTIDKRVLSCGIFVGHSKSDANTTRL